MKSKPILAMGDTHQEDTKTRSLDDGPYIATGNKHPQSTSANSMASRSASTSSCYGMFTRHAIPLHNRARTEVGGLKERKTPALRQASNKVRYCGATPLQILTPKPPPAAPKTTRAQRANPMPRELHPLPHLPLAGQCPQGAMLPAARMPMQLPGRCDYRLPSYMAGAHVMARKKP